MNYADIIKFVKQNPVCTIATTDKQQAHVRAFLSNIVNDTIYFTTSLHKNVGKQISENNSCELCYLNNDFSIMLRIETKIKILKERELKQHFIDTKEYLKGFSADDESFLLLTLSSSKASFWSLNDNMKEDSLQIIHF